jgi:hypothetical protein
MPNSPGDSEIVPDKFRVKLKVIRKKTRFWGFVTLPPHTKTWLLVKVKNWENENEIIPACDSEANFLR